MALLPHGNGVLHEGGAILKERARVEDEDVLVLASVIEFRHRLPP